MRLALLFFVISAAANAQWTLQESHSTASLRGIHSIGNGVAWASGSRGTVLRTVDSGKTWETCTVPPDGEKLDFRGVQAFDAKTAIVMSSGKGDLSRLYKTTDGCRTWKLIATNPAPDGFWDSVRAYSDIGKRDDDELLILGDSVGGQLAIWEWKEGWEERELELSYQARGAAFPQEGSFAASNSVLQVADTPQVDKTWKYSFRWASNTKDHAYISYVRSEHTPTCEPCREERGRVEVPMANGTTTGGVYSFFFRTEFTGVAVGGDFEKPNSSALTTAATMDGGLSWQLPQTFPHGYRSAVAYEEANKLWITVGPNGTDISTDDGKNWKPLTPSSSDTPDADQHWNALSLPFVVGSHGRIGILRGSAINP